MIYDFDEFLGRGIIAQRTGRFQEALKYLNIASKVEPDNPRVWLWLASNAETVSQKREYLKHALRLSPYPIVAELLLKRLDQKDMIVNQPGSDFVVFKCPYCGGSQRFDPDVSGLVCEYCKKIEMLTLQDAPEEGSDLERAPRYSSGDWSVLDGQVSCSASGAKLSILPDQLNHVCPFCGSELISVQSATPNLISPTAVAPFRYHSEDVKERLAKSWNVPISQISRLCDSNRLNLSSIFLPFWAFAGRVQIRCAVGYRVPAEEYSQSDRVIIKGDWPNEYSSYECDIDDLLVYAARSLDDDAIAQITPFDFKSVFSYRPEILAGWQAEFYQLALEDAAVEVHMRMRDLAFHRGASRLLFIEPAKMLEDDICILDQTYKLVLLPVWIACVGIGQGKIDRTLINGQTGKVGGKRKNIWKRIFN
jgi:predicted RNA-binding Zn-ribbon protein involved in translation (DUF1610 family)